MSLNHYFVEYKSVSPEDREKLLEDIETYSFNGAFISPDFNSCEFFLYSNVDVNIIHFPHGSHLKLL